LILAIKALSSSDVILAKATFLLGERDYAPFLEFSFLVDTVNRGDALPEPPGLSPPGIKSS
jgi:hypothetical protein